MTNSEYRKKSLILFLAALLFMLGPLRAAENELSLILQKGLFEEEANQNYEAAARAYMEAIRIHDQQRQLGATALFRLGECYRKLGQTNDAVMHYQRLLQAYPDQPNLVTLAEQTLDAMGIEPAPDTPAIRSVHIPNRQELELIKEQIDLAMRQLAQGRKMVEAGRLPVQGALVYERELIRLRRELALAKEGRNSDKAREFLRQEIALQEKVVELVVKSIQNGREGVGQEIQPMRELLDLKRELAALESAPDEISVVNDAENLEIERLKEMFANSPDLINGPIRRTGASDTTPLLDAAQKGRLSVARWLLQNGADVNRSLTGKTPLHAAAENGHLGMAKLLIEKNANINSRDSEGYTPVALTVLKGFQTLTELLLTQGADPDLPDVHSRSPLFHAVMKADSSMTRTLLEHEATPDSRIQGGLTPLHLAAACGTTNTMGDLLSHGADIEAQDDSGNTPLLLATQNGMLRATQLLLKAKANPNARNSSHFTPLFMVTKYRKPKDEHPSQFIATFGAIHDPFPFPNDPALATLVTTLIQHGADPNEGIAESMIPLTSAIQSNPITVEPLLFGGADPNLIEDLNPTPLYLAVASGGHDIVHLLLQHGADPNVQVITSVPRLQAPKYTNPFRGTPLMRAVLWEQDMLVDLLLENQADPNLKNPEGLTPLMMAIFKNNAPITKRLLEKGANPNETLPDRETHLTYAVQKGTPEIVNLLLEYQADPNAKSIQGNTALHLAVGRVKPEMTELLLKWKADPNAVNEMGESPLSLTKPRAQSAGKLLLPSLPPPPPRATRFQNRLRSIVESSQSESNTNLVALLKGAGAVEWIPKPGQITYIQKETGMEKTIFRKSTNAPNHHALLELIALAPLSFPDFSKITVLRRNEKSGEIHNLHWDVTALVEERDCSKDHPLEWGDMIEIPELVHPLGRAWEGFTPAIRSNIVHCLKRDITISVGNSESTLTLGEGTQFFDGLHNLRLPVRLNDVLRNSGLLLTSSDLSRVKMLRIDRQSGKRLEMVFDLETPPEAYQDLWLRDGDRIEVPQK